MNSLLCSEMNGDDSSSSPIERRSESVSERTTTASNQKQQAVSEAQLSRISAAVASRREITSNRSNEGYDPSEWASLVLIETDGVHKYELLGRNMAVPSSPIDCIKVLEAPIGTVEVVFTGSAVTQHLAFAPADETFTKGVKLIGFVPLANGLPSDLEKDGLLRVGMVVELYVGFHSFTTPILPLTLVTHLHSALDKDRINGEEVTDSEFEVGVCVENTTVSTMQLISTATACSDDGGIARMLFPLMRAYFLRTALRS